MRMWETLSKVGRKLTGLLLFVCGLGFIVGGGAFALSFEVRVAMLGLSVVACGVFFVYLGYNTLVSDDSETNF